MLFPSIPVVWNQIVWKLWYSFETYILKLGGNYFFSIIFLLEFQTDTVRQLISNLLSPILCIWVFLAIFIESGYIPWLSDLLFVDSLVSPSVSKCIFKIDTGCCPGQVGYQRQWMVQVSKKTKNKTLRNSHPSVRLFD